MSTLLPPPPVKPFAAVFSRETDLIDRAPLWFSDFLGEEPDIVSPKFPVKETRYYEPEMGAGLFKVYASWPSLMNPERLADMKLLAMRLEEAHSRDGRRLVNIDPGYIGSGGLVLSTGKFRGHRLPLGGGVWGELTLHYHRGGFQDFPWTYQDYKSPEIQSCLLTMRRALMARLRETGQSLNIEEGFII